MDLCGRYARSEDESVIAPVGRVSVRRLMSRIVGHVKPVRALIDALRGALIGVVEIIPGVSGGTVALIVGLYEVLIESASLLVRAAVRVVTDPVRGRGLSRARTHLAQVRWDVVLPVGIGMILAIVVGARVIAPLVEEYPEGARALFAGLILASLAIPIRMVGGRWRPREWVLALGGAVAAFLLSGVTSGETPEPSMLAVAGAAAVAICALVLPGVSGSFLLVVFGLYGPTLAAVNDRDLGYIGVFALGAMVGLGLFVQVLRWALSQHHRVTLALMTGLMAGSLRALWPWQSADNELLAPGDNAPVMAGLALLGVVIVVALIVTESTLMRRRIATEQEVLQSE